MISVLLLCTLSINSYGRDLRIYAAASLTEVLSKVASAYETNDKIIFNFDGSSKLAHQIKSGAPADIFLSADEDWMNFLKNDKRILEDTRKDFLRNRLVLIVPRNSKLTPKNVMELEGKDYQRIALAGEAVPAGKFARTALRSLGLDPQNIKKKTISADNVKVALKWVSLGEAQAGIVYATDAKVERDVRVVFTFPEETHAPIIYPGAVIQNSKSKKEAKKFLEFLKTERAKNIFIQAGFTPL